MTEWEIFAQARALHDAGDCDGALTLISKARPELERIRGHVACLQASCHERKGNRALALRLLENEIAAGTTNFWVYYQIGGLYEATGRQDAAMAAFRQAHGLQGWPESAAHGYVLSHDYFSPNIPVWKQWFADTITATPIACLEIGSWQGISSAKRAKHPSAAWVYYRWHLHAFTTGRAARFLPGDAIMRNHLAGFFSLAGLFLAGSLPAQDAAELFSKLDANKDGYITPDEMLAWEKKRADAKK